MRLEDYTDEELIIQIRNFDSEIERLKNYRDLFEKQININNIQERTNNNSDALSNCFKVFRILSPC